MHATLEDAYRVAGTRVVVVVRQRHGARLMVELALRFTTPDREEGAAVGDGEIGRASCRERVSTRV
jgi:hypothetical protein